MRSVLAQGRAARWPPTWSSGMYLLFLPDYEKPQADPLPTGRTASLGWVSAQIHADRFLTEAPSGIAAGTAGVDLTVIGCGRGQLGPPAATSLNT